MAKNNTPPKPLTAAEKKAKEEAKKVERAANFKKLAVARTNAAVGKIGLIGNLGNRRNYVYSEEDAASIIAALRAAVDEAAAKFKEDGGKASGFTL